MSDATLREGNRTATASTDRAPAPRGGLRMREKGVVARWKNWYYGRRMDWMRAPRHVRALVRYGTPRRWLNVATVEAEKALGRTKLRGKPYIIFVDPINVCNLRCPLCPTGNGTLARERGAMRLDHYKHIIDEVAPWALEISLYNWGEPLLHPHIFEMVQYAHDRRLATNMSLNFNRVKPSDIDSLINSGLDHLCLSIDGTTQEAYETYRVRGDLSTVLANTRALLARRAALGRRNPMVEWQFIVFKHNEHQLEEARRMAKEVGVDLLRFIPAGLPFNAPNKQDLARQWYSSDKKYRYWDPDAPDFFDDAIRKPGRCFYLYRSMAVNPGGGVAPCCIVDDARWDFGNLVDESLIELWNSDRYRSARAVFNPAAASPGADTVCAGCNIFERPGHGRPSVDMESDG